MNTGHVIEQCQIKMRGDRVRVSLAAKESEIDPTQFTIYIVITETLAFSAANSRLSPEGCVGFSGLEKPAPAPVPVETA